MTGIAVYWARAATLILPFQLPGMRAPVPAILASGKQGTSKKMGLQGPHHCPRPGGKADGAAGSGVGQQRTGTSAPPLRSGEAPS